MVWGASDSDYWFGGAIRSTTSGASTGPLLHILGAAAQTPGSASNLTTVRAIHGTASDDIWFTGFEVWSGRPTVMHWDGSAVAELDGMDTLHFNALFADSPGTFWAVGPQGIWRWNGSALVPHPLALAWPVTLNAVWGSGPDDVWVGGDQFFVNNSNSGRYRAVVVHWDGTTWSSR